MNLLLEKEIEDNIQTDLIAACSKIPDATEIFFSEDNETIDAAKKFCLECQMQYQCLEGAITRGEDYGVWGGQLFIKGKIVAKKRQRGRPKNTETSNVEQVPIPESLLALIA